MYSELPKRHLKLLTTWTGA